MRDNQGVITMEHFKIIDNEFVEIKTTVKVAKRDLYLIQDIKDKIGTIAAIRVLCFLVPSLGLKQGKELVESL